MEKHAVPSQLIVPLSVYIHRYDIEFRDGIYQ